MDDEVQSEAVPTAVEAAPEAPAAKPEAPREEKPREDKPKSDEKPKSEDRPPREARPPREPRGERKDARPPRPGGGGDRPPGQGGDRPHGGGDRPHGRDERRGGEGRRDDRREGGRPGGGRPFEPPPDIELEKLISDSLYLDNQAHAVVARMRDMDSGTKSQLRRLYNAVRRAVRAPESERQHQFVMLRARLAYTIARHSLRSLDALERLLLQVTRKNDAQGYERFKDLFEAIVAYNE
jgi:CRISPR type III-A-associated protein Csm2